MSIKIREIEIGKGIPKICIPVTGTTRKEIRDQLSQIKDQPFDLLEWRADFFEEISDEEARTEMIGEIREYLREKPFFIYISDKVGRRTKRDFPRRIRAASEKDSADRKTGSD